VFNPALTDYLKSGAQVAEASFYRDCAAELTVQVPRALYAGVDPETFAGVILMQDEVPRGTRFLTALSPYTPEQAAMSLDQLARLHGGGWGGDPARHPWLVSKLGYLSTFQGVPGPRLTELLQGERGERLPDAVRDGPRIYAALKALAARGERLPTTFVHGDAHAGNVFEGPEGIGLIDWQLLQRGDWSLDAAYHIAAVLEVEDRRRSEQDLLRHYLERLAAHGGEPPAWDEAWRRYRQSTVYGYFLWAITLRVQPEIIHTFVTRLGTAAADHDGFGLLGV
jgi:hypothetical protein